MVFSSAQIFDSFPSAVYICDAHGKIIYYNAKAIELWGRTPVLNDLQEVFCACYKVYTLEGEFVPKNTVPMVDALSGKSIKDIKAVVERPDGSKIVTQVNISPIRNNQNEIIGAINIFQDISQQYGMEKNLQKINQELKWATEELEQIVYCVSHDLREPLRVATTYIQLLSQKYAPQLDERAQGYILNAVKSCDRVRYLINDLLAFNRVRGDYSSFQMVDLNKALKQAIIGLKLIIDEHNAVITHEDLPSVFGDEAKISLVFQNLIGNAVKFSKDSPAIHIFAKSDHDGCLVGIRDNGIGIDTSSQEKVFDIFERLHPGAAYDGTGMGLAICKKIVEQHEGKIWFQSEANKGTTFYFTLCRKQSKGAPSRTGLSLLSSKSALEPLKTESNQRHVVQIYKDSSEYYRNLTLFVAAGLEKNEAVIVVSTLEHWRNLQVSLICKGFDPEDLIAKERITFIDANVAYKEFIKDGDEQFVHNFSLMGQEVINHTLKKFGKFRAFGELVDVLCAEGKTDLAIEVEKMWHQYVQKYDFALFCAYSSENLKNSNPSKIINICETHTHLLAEEYL